MFTVTQGKTFVFGIGSGAGLNLLVTLIVRLITGIISRAARFRETQLIAKKPRMGDRFPALMNGPTVCRTRTRGLEIVLSHSCANRAHEWGTRSSCFSRVSEARPGAPAPVATFGKV